MIRILLLLLTAFLSAASSQSIDGVVLSNDAWPRATTLKEWTADVMRISGNANASETAQGKTFFEWLRLFSRMAVGGMIQSFEGTPGKEASVLDAHKQLFVYGWGFCDTTSRIAEAAWQEYKGDPRSAERVITQHEDGGYHTMYRLRMDNAYGAFDPRYGYYLVDRDKPDARVLDWAELHGKFETNRAYRHRSRPFFEIAGIEWERALLLHPAYFVSESAWRAAGAPKEHVFGNGQYRMGTAFHDMSFSLPPGTTVTRYWDNSARKFYVPSGQHTKREWPFLPSGRFYRVAETSHNGNWPAHDPNYQRMKPYLGTIPTNEGYPPDLAGSRSIGQAYGVIEYAPGNKTPVPPVLDLRSPYVLVDGTVDIPPGTTAEIRTLEPKPRHAAEPDRWSEWSPLSGKAALQIHGKYRFQVRLSGPGRQQVKLLVYFENSMTSIPPLFAGANTVRLRVADPAALRRQVTVTYRYQTAGGQRQHRQVLQVSDFRGNEAVYQANAPGLLRCESVAIMY
ncbi:MAG: hypothetical protein JNK87_39975 [Bryobacterales bacterium]|nr:hypothetical protein [Bryobacterales bacterium]